MVTVDIGRVRSNLSREAGRPATDEEVRSLLFDCGLRRMGDRWVGPEYALTVLAPDEIALVEAAPEPPPTPHELSREYEDQLDWLENHRHSRIAPRNKRSLMASISEALSTLTKARLPFRRR
jgi:hypothetical protein